MNPTETPEAEVAESPQTAPIEASLTEAAPESNGKHFHYFKKVLADRAFRVGKDAVKFELLERNIGVLVIEEGQQPEVLAALSSAADRRKGGIIRITAEIYDDLKKKLRPVISVPKFGPHGRSDNVRIWRPPEIPRKPGQGQLSLSERRVRDRAAALASGARLGDISKPPKLPTIPTTSKAGPSSLVGGEAQPVSGGGPGGGSGVSPSPAAQPTKVASDNAKPATKPRGQRLRPMRTAAEPSNL